MDRMWRKKEESGAKVRGSQFARGDEGETELERERALIKDPTKGMIASRG